MAGGARVNVRLGQIDTGTVPDDLLRAVTDEVARATVRRVKKRVKHPSVRGMSVRRVNQYAVDVTGVPGPGIIRPVRKRALYWPGADHPVRSVNSPGMGPLVRAEAGRVTERDLNLPPTV